jgi:hypothetical protein
VLGVLEGRVPDTGMDGSTQGLLHEIASRRGR